MAKTVLRALVLALLCSLVSGFGLLSTGRLYADGGRFLVPSAGYVGLLYGPGHNGLDIWTSQTRPGTCGNPVRAAYGGTIYSVKKTTFAADTPGKGDPQASIVVLRHSGVPGLPDPFYTWYLLMAREDGAGTCIADAVWDNLGREVPAGFPLGRQGSLRVAGDTVNLLHFGVSADGDSDVVTYDPAPLLGLPGLQQGEALLYGGQTAYLALGAPDEQDSTYFYAEQGNLATIRMDRLNDTLNSYLLLLAPDGSEVARDDDGGGNGNALINQVYLWQSGYYRVVARSAVDASAGPYSLSLLLTSPPPPTNLSVALIVDSSGSMQDNDNSDLRKAAARFFVDLAQIGDRIAVVDFDHRARVWSSLRTVLTGASRDALKVAVAGVDSDGGTDLGTGLLEGYYQLLADSSTNKKAAIFITDGRQEYGPYENQHLAYAERGWPVYTIGLGPAADSDLLQQIAADTGGQYYAAPSNGVLQNIYRELWSQLQRQVPLGAAQQVTVYPQQTIELTTQVETSPAQLTFALNWSANEVGLSLRTPSGATLDASTVDANVYQAHGSTYALYRINSPEPGTWTVQIKGVSVPAVGEVATLDVSASSAAQPDRLYQVYLPLMVAGYSAESMLSLSPTPSATSLPLPTAPSTPTSAPAPTVASLPSASPTPTPTPMLAPTASSTPTAAPSRTATTTPTATSTPTSSPSPTATATARPASGTRADVAITQSGPITATAGNLVCFSLLVGNLGQAPAERVTITDTLPFQFGVNAVQSSNGRSYVVGQPEGKLVLKAANAIPAESPRWDTLYVCGTFPATLVQATLATNQVEIDTATAELSRANNWSSSIVTVQPAALTPTATPTATPTTTATPAATVTPTTMPTPTASARPARSSSGETAPSPPTASD